MTIALTGATGFIGSRLLDQLSGKAARALTRRSMKPRRGATWVEGALDQPESLFRLVDGADSVIHIAGAITGRTARDFDSVNVDGTSTLVEAAKAAGVRRFVHVSSLAAREPSVSLYGVSKAKSEEVVGASGLDFVIVRPPAVYGPGDKETLELFKWAKRGIVILPPSGRTSMIHVDDLARLLLALAEETAPSKKTYEPDDGCGGVTHHELARSLGEAVGRKPFAVSMPRKVLGLGALIDQAIRGPNAKLTRDRASYFCHPDWVSEPSRSVPRTLWAPEISLAEGLSETAAWYRSHGWL